MIRPKIYLETTIFNHFFDKERDQYKATVQLFKEIKEGKFEPYTSVYAFRELDETKEEPKRTNMLNLIKEYDMIFFEADDEAERLAELYMEKGIVPRSSDVDAQHIAISAVKGMDCILSLNFSHINRAKTKKLIPLLNKLEGYDADLQIYSPMEVINNGLKQK